MKGLPDQVELQDLSPLTSVAAMIKTAPLEQAPEAYARVIRGKADCRMVLVTGQ
jgi:D-arabinose 1-dehydrogenase-like Zn-dependent alcohol dehydrogenase